MIFLNFYHLHGKTMEGLFSLPFMHTLVHALTHTHSLTRSGATVSGAHAVARYLCRLVPGTTLYGKTNLERAEVWEKYYLLLSSLS